MRKVWLGQVIDDLLVVYQVYKARARCGWDK